MWHLYLCLWLRLAAAAPASLARWPIQCMVAAPPRLPSKRFSGPLRLLGQDLPICHEQRLHGKSSHRLCWQFAGSWGSAPAKLSSFTLWLARRTGLQNPLCSRVQRRHGLAAHGAILASICRDECPNSPLPPSLVGPSGQRQDWPTRQRRFH